MKKLFVIITILFSVSLFAHQGGSKSIIKIDSDYQSGTISYEESLLQKFHVIFDESKLAGKYQVTNDNPVKCGTALIKEYRDNINDLSEETKNIVEGYLNKSKADNVSAMSAYISPYEKFEITYSTTGTDAVPSADNNSNSVPDYVERIADYFDHSWRVLIDTLGFKPVPLSTGEYYQISFENMGAYGYATVTGGNAGTRIVMHNTYVGFPPNDDPEGNVWGAAKVTAVHEFKHAIQFLYNNWGEPSWFIEADATWSEDIGFDIVNDYYNYLSASQIRQPGRALSQGDGYEDNLYFHFFTEKYGINTNREIWERREQFSENVYSSVDNMLSDYGASFDEAFAEYFVWLYNTGNKYNPELPGFGEAQQYPNPIVCKSISEVPYSDAGCDRSSLSANFIEFNSSGQNNFLHTSFNSPNGSSILAVIINYFDNTSEVRYVEFPVNGELSYVLQPNLSEIEKIVLIPVVTSTSGTSFEYDYTLQAFQTAQFTHIPLNDTEVTGNIEITTIVETPLDLAYIDSLKLFYSINDQAYQALSMTATGNTDEYSAVIPDPGNGVQVNYYFRIADQFEQKIYHPVTAPESVFSFYVGADTQAPELIHASLTGTPKYNLPVTVYAEVTDNIGLDSVYIEYRLNEGNWVKEDLTNLTEDLYYGVINYNENELNEGDVIDYKLTAIDVSAGKNTSQLPASDFFSFDVAKGYKYSSSSNVEIKESILLDIKDTIMVADNYSIEDINIYFISDHGRFSDLTIRLVDPNGNNYGLVDRDWLETSYETAVSSQVVFDQDAYFNFSNADLTVLNETSVSGSWILRVFDKDINQIKGNLLEWGLIVKAGNVTSVENPVDGVAIDYKLFQNYPNPFNPSTKIKYSVPKQGHVKLKVFDILGKEIATLVDEIKSNGIYEVTFDASSLSSGIYFVRIASKDFIDVKKIMLMK